MTALVHADGYVPAGPTGAFVRAGSLSKLVRSGGAEGNRTPDLCSAIAALSHLSYGPVLWGAPDSDGRRAMQ